MAPSAPTSPKRRSAPLVLAGGALLFVLGALALAAALGESVPLSGDFLGYWAAAALTWQGENAYDLATVQQLQRTTGRSFDFTVLTWNPPWTPVLLLPFGWLTFPTARLLWLFLSYPLLALVGHALQRLFWPTAARTGRLVGLIVPLLALPSWLSLIMGQINLLVLAGITGALFFFHRAPLLGGALLIFATVKPQLSIGVLGLFAIRALVERQWRFVLGAALFFSALLLVLTLLRPAWWADYRSVLETPLLAWRTPTLATWAESQWPTLPVRPLFFGAAVVGFVAVTAWAYRSGQWETATAMVLIVTMLTTFFGWSYDQIMLLIPLYFLIGTLHARRSLLGGVGLLFGLLNLLMIATKLHSQDEFDFFWVVPLFTLCWVGLLWAGRLHDPQPTTRRA